MTQETINIGASANATGADTIRVAFGKVNNNFTDLYPQTVPTHSTGKVGDIEGMIAFDSTYFYYCTAPYDGTTNIWKRHTHDSGTW
jgi:hypothetical protein